MMFLAWATAMIVGDHLQARWGEWLASVALKVAKPKFLQESEGVRGL